MIWCVDDDATIREIEVYTLQQTGFEARGFKDGYSVLEALKKERPELMVLDIMMPGMDGIALLQQLRSQPDTRDIPVIMATAKGTEMDRIAGLNLGADDYLVKPFGVMEMVARIKAVLRRSQKEAPLQELQVGGITLREKEHRVTANGQIAALTSKEYDMLRLFLKHPDRVFTRDQLMSEIWGTEYLGESRTVDMHIKTLRKKLGSSGGQIKTVIGVGYRMEYEP